MDPELQRSGRVLDYLPRRHGVTEKPTLNVWKTTNPPRAFLCFYNSPEVVFSVSPWLRGKLSGIPESLDERRQELIRLKAVEYPMIDS